VAAAMQPFAVSIAAVCYCFATAAAAVADSIRTKPSVSMSCRYDQFAADRGS